MSSIEQIIKDNIRAEVSAGMEGVENKVSEKIYNKVMTSLNELRPLEIKIGEKKEVVEGLNHHKFEEVLHYIAARVSLILVGPAGSGKTHIAFQCAKALGVDAYSISVNEQTSKADFMGYTDANGKMVKTNFRKAYEKGGVFIVDEIDCGNPNILTIVNSALSNDMCPFPDGMVKRHDQFVCVCTANTFGEGESVQYVGRNVLDSATKDRFSTVFIDYDKNIEMSISPKWVNMVAEIRNYFKANNTQFVLSTRGIQRLARLESVKGKKLVQEDIKNCLNLHTNYDNKVRDIVTKYL